MPSLTVENRTIRTVGVGGAVGSVQPRTTVTIDLSADELELLRDSLVGLQTAGSISFSTDEFSGPENDDAEYVTLEWLKDPSGGLSELYGPSNTTVSDVAVTPFHDYDPGTFNYHKFDTSLGNRELTGIANGVDGKILIVHNTQIGNDIDLRHQNVNSAPENRFILPGGSDDQIGPAESRTFIYDGISQRWRMIVSGRA